MNRAWYVPLVIAAWVASTGWLLAAKVLPAWLPGAPPGYQGLHTAEGRLLPVAWTVLLDDDPLGWSVSRATRDDAGAMRVDSLLHLDRLPVSKLLPAWARLLVASPLPADEEVALEVRGGLDIDPRGRLRTFSSTVDLGDGARILLSGTVADGEVTVDVTAGDMHYRTTRHLPDRLLLGDEFSPQATLPGLVPGRTWTVPVYGPLRPAQSPIEILHAEVEGTESILWEDRLVTADVVAYRDDPGAPREPRMRIWVDRTGRVLRQEATTLGRRLAFVRRDDEAAAALAGAVADGQLAPAADAAVAPAATAPSTAPSAAPSPDAEAAP